MTMVPVDMAGGVFSFGEENGAKMAANAMPPPPRLTLFYIHPSSRYRCNI